MKSPFFLLLTILALSSFSRAGEVNVSSPGSLVETGFVVDEGIGVVDPEIRIGKSSKDIATLSNKKTHLDQS